VSERRADRLLRPARKALHKAYTAYVDRLTNDTVVQIEHEGDGEATLRAEAERRIEPRGFVEIGPPWGRSHPHDSDLQVPEFYGDFPDVRFAVTRWRASGDRAVHRIFYNTRRIGAWNPGPSDWMKIRLHERAHARGFDHWEGSPRTNDCYYPTIRITGR
jgi:hypothetical protein